MKESHPTTERLLDRALEYLITTDLERGSTVTLNNKTYKQISFSAQQVIDTMHQLAVPGDVAITSRSSFRNIDSKPNAYKQKIERAKIKKIARETGKSGLTSIGQQLNTAELTQEVMTLTAQNNSLRSNIAALESFIAQAELEAKLEDTQPKINTLPSDNEKHKIILKQLLQYLFEDELIFAVAAKGKVAPSIRFDRLDGSATKICNLIDLKEIVDIKTDGSGKISIETK